MSEELDHLRAALDACRAEQHELDEFISLLAHDLRTPLTSIRGYAQLMMRQRPGQPALDPATVSGLQTIIEQSDRLAELTGLLLDVSRIRLSRVALRRTDVDLTHTARAVIAAWPGEGERPALEAPESGLVVSADSNRAQQMLRALFTYAATREGAKAPLRVRLALSPPDVTVAVEDEGEALPDETASRLLDQLVIPAGGAGATEASTGLGAIGATGNTGTWRLAYPELYIARGLAEAHGGDLKVESPVPPLDRGLRLTLRLPGVQAA